MGRREHTLWIFVRCGFSIIIFLVLRDLGECRRRIVTTARGSAKDLDRLPLGHLQSALRDLTGHIVMVRVEQSEIDHFAELWW